MTTKFQCTRLVAALVAAWGVSGGAQAQLIINDSLTGGSSSYDWRPLNGACLTAGNNTGSIPACNGLSYYSGKVQVGGTTGRLPDLAGQGALRLTNGDKTDGGANGDNQTGAVVSNFTFPTNQGLQVTFTTVTYGGDNLNGHGADGISFFLMDGTKSPSVGALGGSLGYSCSNSNGTYDGVIGAYIGIGIDEYGNFSNPGDNTDTGPGFGAGRISLRGAGSTAWASLTAAYPTLYPAGLADKATAVKNTCKTGYLWNYSGGSVTDANGNSINNSSRTTQKLAFNYPMISYQDLPSTVNIANQQALDMPKRGDAVPITYSIRLDQDGTLDFAYSVNGGAAQTVIANTRITDSNGPLPSSFRFGFSSGTGGGNNVHEITCFKAAPVSASNSSAGTNVQQSAQVEAGSQVYLAYYHPINWWGQMTAQSLVYNAASDTVSINALANWDASCTLTGGACQAMGGTSTVTAIAPGSRNILSWSGTGGIPFTWSSLSSGQKTALTTGDSGSANDNRLQYLRGDRTREIASGGAFRTRTGVLGDIVSSSPTWVGYPTSPYDIAWTDALYPTGTPAETTGAYATFKSTYAGRLNMVYVGANDGFMHGFQAGAYDGSGNFASTTAKPNDGKEKLAYIPAAVISSIHSSTSGMDYASPQYSHNFYMDGTPGTGDLFYAGAWHTWLVGGLGAGGSASGPIADRSSTATGALFALDITNPEDFSESNAASLVVGEWTSSTISCVGASTCGTSLGSQYGIPAIRRLHNGNWAVLFGNGLNSSSGLAGLYIMLVDPSTGSKTFRYISTGSGATGGVKNGIASVAPVDLDGDHIVDYVYAGDVLGHVWRFDLTDSNPSNWTVRSTPLITTDTGQPITSKVTVASIPPTLPGEKPRVMVSFGTGQMLPQTATTAAVYASGTQTLYGVWDWDMVAWNAKTASAASRYQSLVGPQTVTTSTLQAQSVTGTTAGTGTVSGYRTVSASKICWSGSTGCTSGNTKFGWKLPLPSSNEQVIYNPLVAYGMFIVNTTIPGAAQALTCDTQPPSGFTMAVTVAGGGASTQSFFSDSSGNFVSANGSIVNGLGLGATGTPSIVTVRPNGFSRPFLVQQTVSGTGTSNEVNPGANGKGGRLNWKKIR